MRRSLLPFACAVSLLFAGAAGAAEPASKAEVERYARQLMEKAYPVDGPGAAILVARGDEVLYRGARGRASIELDVPLNADQVFRMGSITKQMAAAGLLTLVEQGKLSLDDPLSKFLPDYPGGGNVSVRMLLNHTSGIKSYTGIPGVMEGPIMQDRTTAQMIETFKDLKPDFAPGQGYAYNNSGYVLVGAVIEKASGQPWHAYLKQALFEPLGMRHTGYGLESAGVIAGMVQGYTGEPGHPAKAGYLSMTQPHAAGALVTTVDDLLRWNRALHEGKVLKDATYRQMVTPVGKAIDAGYGFGIQSLALRGQPMLEHGGGIHGFATRLLYLPGSDITVAVLQNTDSPAEGEEPGDISRRLAAFTLGEPFPEPIAVAVDPARLQSALGTYRAGPERAFNLHLVDGKPVLQEGERRHAVVPLGPDDFVYAHRLTRFRIERDASGRATAMRYFRMGDGDGERIPRGGDPLTP
ncbi:serine hydrolase domain-containing protein [Pseudoxanthomonas sp. z9]|uniref:serine hydrolase domain-containing protein n=1 Tax=Pseudoxanthomonas sp. z9 TaxID=2584942 RepID=UPI0015E8AA66|nr:serine hydrolase domain-containing protein [Pseudoxanthomonas sp. z9]